MRKIKKLLLLLTCLAFVLTTTPTTGDPGATPCDHYTDGDMAD